MVLTEAEILKIKAELDRVKEASDVDDEHVKDLEKELTEYVEKFKLVGTLFVAMLKLFKGSSAKQQASSSQSVLSNDEEKKK